MDLNARIDMCVLNNDAAIDNNQTDARRPGRAKEDFQPKMVIDREIQA